jgi:ribosomal protein S18 acetylase RimI-like enzyme
MLTIRPATRADDDAIWDIFRAVTAPGDAFVFAPDTPREVALGYWFQPGGFPFVAEHEGRVVGAYLIKPNQPGLGAHVANGAYMVSPAARGLGVGRAMGEHSLREAKRAGFRAVQFNAVVSTNEAAVKLWTALGFRVLARLPAAFRHTVHGYVDLLVMFRELDDV